MILKPRVLVFDAVSPPKGSPLYQDLPVSVEQLHANSCGSVVPLGWSPRRLIHYSVHCSDPYVVDGPGKRFIKSLKWHGLNVFSMTVQDKIPPNGDSFVRIDDAKFRHNDSYDVAGSVIFTDKFSVHNYFSLAQYSSSFFIFGGKLLGIAVGQKGTSRQKGDFDPNVVNPQPKFLPWFAL